MQFFVYFFVPEAAKIPKWALKVDKVDVTPLPDTFIALISLISLYV